VKRESGICGWSEFVKRILVSTLVISLVSVARLY